jgi:nitronate monooxygenase
VLSTPWSRQIGLRAPIVNAPMGGVAGGRLAAAVTAAGGLGMVGMGSAGSTPSLQSELQHVRGIFGIGLVDWVIRKEPGLLDSALAAQPVLLSVSFCTDWLWVDQAHDTGIVTATQVYDSGEAQRAQDAGVDVLVARGAEGGGHGDVKVATLPLLDAVPWPARFPSRVLSNDFVAQWAGREAALAADPGARAELTAGIAGDDRRIAPVDAGQGVAMVTGVTPAGQVIEQLCAGAQRLLAGWGSTD